MLQASPKNLNATCEDDSFFLDRFRDMFDGDACDGFPGMLVTWRFMVLTNQL